MRAVAIITARGGSKRIPRKNIRDFGGKPILAYSIEAAIASGIFDTVMVSTEDEEIAELARKYGAEVPFMRSAENADDYAVTKDVVKEVLDDYVREGECFDVACCIYPTAPFVTAEAIKTAMETLAREQADVCIPVVKFSFPPQRCVVVNEGRLVPKWPECMKMRSQDLEPYYHDCGQFYCLDVKAFLEQKAIWMKDIVPFIQDESTVQDIDTEEDWKIAELKYKIMNKLVE